MDTRGEEALGYFGVLSVAVIAFFYVLIRCCRDKRTPNRRQPNSTNGPCVGEGSDPPPIWWTEPYVDGAASTRHQSGETTLQFPSSNRVEFFVMEPPKYALAPPSYESLYFSNSESTELAVRSTAGSIADNRQAS